MRLPPKMPQRAMVRIWVASLHQKSFSVTTTLELFVLYVRETHECGWIRTASTRRIVRRAKKPQWGFFRCAARDIHPRPPRNPVSEPGTGFSVLQKLFSGLGGWIRTAAEPTAACGGSREARQAQLVRPAVQSGAQSTCTHPSDSSRVQTHRGCFIFVCAGVQQHAVHPQD